MKQDTVSALAQNFIYAVKTNNDYKKVQRELAQIKLNDLITQLNNDQYRLSFWINIYNGYTQLSLQENAAAYNNKHQFFTRKFIVIAGNFFSLDDIEHGILRRSRLKWSMGYLQNPFPQKIIKQLMLQKINYRIHFALNCGAKSCPPIAFYKAERIDMQLNIATSAYLSSEAEYNEGKNILQLPALMNWFRADFGGSKNMINLAKKIGIIPANKIPKIIFKKYNWDLQLSNFS